MIASSEKVEVRWKKMDYRHLILFLLLTSPFSLLPCRILASGEPDAFALPGVGARSGGMGGAFIGLSDEIESIYYNPAGLGNLVQNGLTATYSPPALQTYRSFVALNKRWGTSFLPGSVAFGWLRLASSNIEITNTDEQILGSDTLTNDLFLLGAGVHPWPHWSVGGTLKYYRFSFDGFDEKGVGMDLGVHAQYNPIRFGVALTDLGATTLTGNSIVPGAPRASDQVPTRIRPGVALVWQDPFDWPIHVSFDADEILRLQGAQDAQLRLGGELWAFHDGFAFRSGYQQAGGPTFGFGARWGVLQFDYSFLLSLDLQDQHRLSTTFRF